MEADSKLAPRLDRMGSSLLQLMGELSASALLLDGGSQAGRQDTQLWSSFPFFGFFQAFKTISFQGCLTNCRM